VYVSSPLLYDWIVRKLWLGHNFTEFGTLFGNVGAPGKHFAGSVPQIVAPHPISNFAPHAAYTYEWYHFVGLSTYISIVMVLTDGRRF